MQHITLNLVQNNFYLQSSALLYTNGLTLMPEIMGSSLVWKITKDKIYVFSRIYFVNLKQRITLVILNSIVFQTTCLHCIVLSSMHFRVHPC